MKTSAKIIITIGLLSPVLFLAFIPRNANPLDKLVANLQLWRDSIPQEKVYLHLDKPYYALGDTIWFKGYLTIGPKHQLSALSGAMYVELINEKDSLLQQLKLPVTSGMVMGNFILKDDYHQGNYRIRAYTQWMRNAGEDYFYDHTFSVGDVAGGDIVAKADFSYRDDKGKQVLTAILNYTNDEGKAWGDKTVRYEIWAGHKALWQQNSKTDALGSLRIVIPDDIKQHPDGTYVHTILQGGDKYPVIRDFPVKATLSQSDVQFFPESGNLVNGATSRVAFKAVGIDGLGINIKGSIVDNDHKEIAKLQTLHAGMSSFLLSPAPGKTYTANVIFEDGSTKSVTLPKAVDEGYVLSVYQPNKDSILVRIHASGSLLTSSVNLITHTGGETVFAMPVKIEKPITSVWLEKKAFPSGIAQFTLFNSNGEPSNERIAFIRSNDLMQLNVKMTKSSYSSKDRVQIDLDAKDSQGKPTAGNFSVSVIDESKIPFDENKESTIFSNLLLTADLKGYIEQPNYYFAKTNGDVDRALDNLMLTQGYRRFTWKELNNTITAKPQFAAEGLGTVITGRVTTLNDKPVADANVSLVALRANAIKSAIVDNSGHFHFEPFFLTDSIKFAIQARTKKGSDKVKLLLDSIPGVRITPNPNLPDASLNIYSTLKQYLESGKKEDDAYEKLGMLDKVHRLKEVKIRAQKPDPLKSYAQQWGPIIPEGLADQTYYPKNLEKFGLLGMGLQGELHRVFFKDYTPPRGTPIAMYPYIVAHGHLSPMVIYLDGRKLDPEEGGAMFDGSQLEPTDVVRIDLVGPNFYIYSKPEDQKRRRYNPSMANVTPKGFNKVREFYSPRYDKPGSAAQLPDLRSTIYWNPYLKTNVNGKTLFGFFNADGPGTYKIIIEGINADGQLGRQVYHYTVEAGQAKAYVPPSPVQDNSLKLITAPLDSFNKRLPAEKVYLHTDKPYYNIGDTLWFKSYVVKGADLSPSKLSGLLYVELDDDSAQMVRRVSVNIKDGLGWGQIPLPKKIFQEGGYTLRAYTNWMQNFNQDAFFSQRFYLGVPSQNTWLVNSNAGITRLADKDQLQVELKLARPDKYLSPVALKTVEVKIYDEWHYLYKQNLQTGIDGSLKFSHTLNDKADGRRIRVQLTSLEKDDYYKVVQVPLVINRSQNLDLQFLPEGGKLVAGLKSTVGFKAVSEDGKGQHVTGDIYDSKGNKIMFFSTFHKGMGSFDFTPQANETYTAKITQPAGITKTFILPQAAPAGTVMHVTNPDEAGEFKVSLAGLNTLSTDSAWYLVGTAKGKIYYSQKVEPNTAELTVSKKLFPTGLVRLTFFKGLRPINERAIFVDKHDQLDINIIPDKLVYATRDSVSLTLEAKDKNGFPVQGNFSLAVTDDSQVKPDSLGNNNIATNLLLNSELKGDIEEPGYYINRKDKRTWQALDNLLLTQGWTAYDWKDVFAPAKPPAFKAEKEFKITGRVVNLFNKPVTHAPVLISSQKPSFITTAITDDNGVYTFKNLPQIDSGSFFIEASNSKGKKLSFGNVSVEKFRGAEVPETLRNPVLPWYVNTDSIQLNYVKRKIELSHEDDIKLSGRVLKEVQIKARKIIPNSVFDERASLTFDEQDIKESAVMNLYELLRQKLPGIKIVNKHSLPGLMFQGNYVDVWFDTLMRPGPFTMGPNPTVEELIEELSEFKIATFKGMQIYISGPVNGAHYSGGQIFAAESRLLTQGSSAYLFERAHLPTNEAIGVTFIGITTGNHAGWYKSIAPDRATYRPLPILYPQQFYRPRYTAAKSPNASPDYRPTLFWEPNINTDINGRAKISFYTSDIKSSYTVKISGIDADGNIGDRILKINQPKPHETNN